MLFNVKNRKETTNFYSRSDVILFADFFEKFIKKTIEDFDINPVYRASLPHYFFKCGMQFIDIKLQTLQDKELTINIRGGINSIIGCRYVKSDDIEKLLCFDANSFFGRPMCDSLPYDEINLMIMFK